ncbi:MAG: Crp/Fnr family transcriptional regulator [Chloroflexota bacterium]
MAAAGAPFSGIALFARLPEAALDELARNSQTRNYPTGQVLWTEGDPGNSLIVLESGQLRVTRFADTGQEVVLAVLDAPAALGEMSLIDGEPRSATVIAQRPVTVRVVPRQAFLGLLREPAAVQAVLRTLAGMIRSSNERYADVVGLDVPGRLAKWLLARAGEGSREIRLGRTQAELAAELGATRESLNRALRRFSDLGLLELDGDMVTILDPAGLGSHAS